MDGDTINVHLGTYDEYIHINKSLVVQAAVDEGEALIQPTTWDAPMRSF
jgi:hypothetical protein